MLQNNLSKNNQKFAMDGSITRIIVFLPEYLLFNKSLNQIKKILGKTFSKSLKCKSLEMNQKFLRRVFMFCTF